MAHGEQRSFGANPSGPAEHTSSRGWTALIATLLPWNDRGRESEQLQKASEMSQRGEKEREDNQDLYSTLFVTRAIKTRQSVIASWGEQSGFDKTVQTAGKQAEN